MELGSVSGEGHVSGSACAWGLVVFWDEVCQTQGCCWAQGWAVSGSACAWGCSCVSRCSVLAQDCFSGAQGCCHV